MQVRICVIFKMRSKLIASVNNVSAAVDFSYANINVKGLEAAHSAGWTGEGATVRVVDEFAGSFTEYIDNGVGEKREFTHGANTRDHRLCRCSRCYYC